MITFPSFKDVLTRLRNDFQVSNSDSNPFLRTGFLKALLDTHAGRYTDIYRKMEEGLSESFISTSSEYGLLQHANENGLTQRSATKAQGQIIAIGVLNEVIPVGTEFVASNGEIFTSTTTTIIKKDYIVISSIVQLNGTATVTAVNHGLGSGTNITIIGAIQSDYNGTFTIEALSGDTFTYSVHPSTQSPATGAISATVTRGIVFVEAEKAGISGNLSANEKMDFVITSPNLNSEVVVLYPALTGGADVESISDFKLRILDFVREPVAPFNVPSIINKIKETVPTATRVFVNETTPSTGQVTVYFVMDEQDNILPSNAMIQTAKNSLINIIPVVVDFDDVFVKAPTLIQVNFTFSSISPSTQTMRDTIKSNLVYFFSKTKEGLSISKDDYTNVLINTIDTSTGAKLESYNLTAPNGTIAITAGSLGVLGNVTF